LPSCLSKKVLLVAATSGMNFNISERK